MLKITKNSAKRYKIPRKIQIGPYTITVKLVNPDNIPKDFGQWNSERLEIKIDKTAKTPQIPRSM